MDNLELLEHLGEIEPPTLAVVNRVIATLEGAVATEPTGSPVIERLAIVLDDEVRDHASLSATRALAARIVGALRGEALFSGSRREPGRTIAARWTSPTDRSTSAAAGRASGHRRLPWTIAAVGALLLASGTIFLATSVSGRGQRIFPSNVSAPSASPRGENPTGAKLSWRQVHLISAVNLAEGEIPSTASMLSCPTSQQCYAISDPALRRISAAPDYLMDVGSGSLDVSSDGGNTWSAAPLPTGMTFTTPLVCENAKDCAVGALNLGQAETIGAIAPTSASSIVAELVGSTSQPKACTFGQLTETQVLAALADYSQVASAANEGVAAANGCAGQISSNISGALSGGTPPGQGMSPQFSILPGGGDLSALQGTIDSMALYNTHGMSAMVEATTDGGATWSAVSMPSGTGPVISLSCPSPSTCMALKLDHNVIGPWDAIPGVSYNVPIFEPVSFTETTNDGASWSTTSFPDPEDTPISISCSSTTSCLAVGIDGTGTPAGTHTGPGLVLTTTNGGRSWASATLPSDVSSVVEATCPSAAVCFAIGTHDPLPNSGEVLSSADGGTNWTPLALPSGIGHPPLTAISCPSVTNCSISGQITAGITSGGSWHSIGSGSSGYSSRGVSGPKGPFSPVDGPNSGPSMVLSTDDGGATWASQTFGWREADGNELLETTDIQCPAENRCIAIGSNTSLAVQAIPVLVGSK